ncbi:hypothetical protein T10_5836 [Trichinella papuae]|uniref:Uncharacterized protein n=1 Tax=Trichinella papuae TaxID=268474 RepID=A0A0V1MUR0_9BILA|nr:hypothetical protein T10_5836 [Trichinella papuae]
MVHMLHGGSAVTPNLLQCADESYRQVGKIERVLVTARRTAKLPYLDDE